MGVAALGTPFFSYAVPCRQLLSGIYLWDLKREHSRFPELLAVTCKRTGAWHGRRCQRSEFICPLGKE